MPSGAKKRKAAKKKQEEQASSTLINLKSNNHGSRSQGEMENNDGVSSQENLKKSGFNEEGAIGIEKDTDEVIDITDSSHDHDKSTSSSSSSNSSSDDESQEVKKTDDNKETGDSVSEVITMTSEPVQPVPIAGDAPFMGCTANAIVENTGFMESAIPSDPNSGELIEISHDDTTVSNETDEKPLPKPTEIVTTEVSLASNEISQASSGENDSEVKQSEEEASALPELSVVPEGNKESDVVVSHEKEAPVPPTHGIAQRTSWFSCCGLFDVVKGSSK